MASSAAAECPYCNRVSEKHTRPPRCILSAILLLRSGARLGAFEIVSLLGAGGMGEVYRARDTRLNRTVAVKILNSDRVGHPERFRREAQAISRLSHPHICSLYDIGEANGTAFLVMEYLEGRTLADRLSDGPLPLEQALRHGIEICDALDRAHRQGVIHRDVKPGNVMLTREGAKLLDFGLAKLRKAEDGIAEDTTASLHLTREGEMVGTVLYMAPEQLEGRESDARTDIFAFGVVLYEMITGRQPFTGASRASIIASILTSDPPSVSALQPLVSQRLDRLVKRCLTKNPDERWQTARDLGYELREIAEEGAHAASRERERKSRAILAGALIGAGLVAAVSVGAWIFRPGDTSQPSYQRLTFRRGIISSARFAPDGQTVIFSAAWDARPYELFLTRLGSTESRSLGMANGRILSVSSAGEMAVLLGTQTFFGGVGTLTRASLAGGLPREVMESVTEADWGPDGALAVVKRRENRMELEFPVGTKLYEARSIWSMRVSPKGDRVAFFESHAPSMGGIGELVVVDRSLKRATLAKTGAALGLAWSPRGDEVWFTSARSDGPPAIRAVSLSSRERLVERVPAPLKIDDISRDGRVLVTKGLNLGGITCLVAGETREREVGWLDGARVEGLSADGKTLLFGAMEGNWINGAYTRATDGSPAVRLGDGHPESLSPDGKWVLARAPGAPSAWGREWVLVPTGPGSPRLLPRGAITQLVQGAWLPDGKRIVFTAIEEGRATRAYVQDVESGHMRPITPERVQMPEKAATPDGRSVLVWLDGKWFLYPIDGGQPRHISLLGADDNPQQWSADGRFLYVTRGRGEPPVAIERLDVTTGRRERWKTLVPSDPVGVELIDPPVISPDGRGYCYSYARRHQELYVVEGLK
jgi:eukaryotic-like serine/threonine-protein kinase